MADASLSTNIQNLVATQAGALKATRVLLNANAADLSALDTTAKGSLLAAINEVFSIANAAANSGGAVINDAAASTSETYSSDKIVALIAALILDSATAAGTTWSSSQITTYVADQLSTLLGGAPAALDTLKLLADSIGDDANYAASVTAALANKIDLASAQTYTSAQIAQGQANLVAIGMATAASVSALQTAIGDTTVDYAAAFTTALNS